MQRGEENGGRGQMVAARLSASPHPHPGFMSGSCTPTLEPKYRSQESKQAFRFSCIDVRHSSY